MHNAEFLDTCPALLAELRRDIARVQSYHARRDLELMLLNLQRHQIRALSLADVDRRFRNNHRDYARILQQTHEHIRTIRHWISIALLTHN